jgi:phosphatidylinositol kinase/protein kinase (PI-3  family)
MEALRGNKGSIMAMLEAFVLDPLAVWFALDIEKTQQATAAAAAQHQPHRLTNDREEGGDSSFFVDGGIGEGVDMRPGKKFKGFIREVDKEAVRISGRQSKIIDRVEEKVGCNFFFFFVIIVL